MAQCDSLKGDSTTCSRPATHKVFRRLDGHIIECLCRQHASMVALVGLADDLALTRMQPGDKSHERHPLLDASLQRRKGSHSRFTNGSDRHGV